MNWIDKEVAFYDFIWAYGVGAHTDCINQELYEDFAAGGDKFEKMKELILQKFPTRETAMKEFEAESTTPTEPQHSHKPDKVKPLAQYLAEYIEHEKYNFAGIDERWGEANVEIDVDDLGNWLQQALDAYQSTENVTIKIERNV